VIVSEVALAFLPSSPHRFTMRFLERQIPPIPESPMAVPRWELFPRVADHPQGREWLQILADLQRAPNTLDAYGRSLEIFLRWCAAANVEPALATRFNIVGFLAHLKGDGTVIDLYSRALVSLSTLQVRLSALRSFFDYLVEEGVRDRNPVGRGRYSPKNFRGAQRGLLPRPKRLPWIPTESEWERVLDVTCAEPVRNRLMFALAYCGALRREEVCEVDLDHLDVARRLIIIPPGKSRSERVVTYTAAVDVLLREYFTVRRTLTHTAGALFRSSSNRNRGSPLGHSSWTKIVERLAERADLPRFTTHTLRHLRLTNLARAGWQIQEIMTYAGHRQVETTMIYIHLSGRDLSAKVATTMASIDARLARLGPPQ
jgi:integrase/recombinase XerD